MTTAGLGTWDSGQEPKASDTNDKVGLLLQQLPSLSFSVPSPKSLVPPFLSEDFLRDLLHGPAAVACPALNLRECDGRLQPVAAHHPPGRAPAESAGGQGALEPPNGVMQSPGR